MVLLGEQWQKAGASLSQAWDAGILHLVLDNSWERPISKLQTLNEWHWSYQVHSTHCYHNCPFSSIVNPCDQHTTSSPLSSHMYTQFTLTSSLPYPRRPSPQYLPSLPQSSPSKELSEIDGGSISTAHTNSDCSQTHRSTSPGHCTWIFIVAISKPPSVLKPEVCRSPGSASSKLKLSAS